MYASSRVRLRQVAFLFFLGAVLTSIPERRVAAQEAALRWDGLIELISGRYNYPAPTIEPQAPADSASTMSRHAVSADGRYILFNSDASNLGMGYHTPALYLRDRRTNELQVLLAGAALNGTLSADGNHVAFEICDPYSRPEPRPDGAGICDVYVLDRRYWSWTLMSATPDGTFGDAPSGGAVLSGNGRFVVFSTEAANLSGGSPGSRQLMLRDRDADGNGIFDEPGTAVLETVSVGGASGQEVGNDDSETPEVSDDGRFVAFRSRAPNLVADDYNSFWDVFLRDRQTRQTRRLNLRGGIEESAWPIESPQISMTPDGRFVAYASADPMLAPAVYDDLNGVLDVYVFDRLTDFTTRVDIGWGPPIAGGLVPGNSATDWPTLSADGRYVSVQSAATNVEAPPPPGGPTHVYVVDRQMQTATRVSIRPDGTEPDADSVRPTISADGTLVAFFSQALNLAPDLYAPLDRIYAAVHFDVTPSEAVVPGSGGGATFTVTTQQHTQWWLDWTFWENWWRIEPTPPFGVGNGEIAFLVPDPNPAPTPRSYTVRILSKTALLTQLEGMSLGAISPTSGPAEGGTQVTLTGTGFEPGVIVVFDGYEAVTEFVSSTTLIATTPPHAPWTVWVAVFSSDYRQAAWIDSAFRYTDSTPPEVWAWASGDQGEDGWFRSDVYGNFAWWDPDGPVTSTTGCESFVVTVDTPGSTFSCSVTSEGGTASGSITIKRDTTPPTVVFTAPPLRQMHELGEAATSAFTCSDALSGVAACGTSAPPGSPIDTSTPGWHTLVADATDRAGSLGSSSLEYAVGTNACAAGLPESRGWWRMEGNTRNTRSNVTSEATRVGLSSDVYTDALVGQGYVFEGPNGYLDTNFGFVIPGNLKYGIAAWVRPSANALGTILRKKDQYSVARTASGTVAWAFRKWYNPALTYFDTGVVVPLNVWTHVAVVLDGTAVRTYLNGRLAHTATNIGDVYTWDNLYETVTLGGAEDRAEYFKGVLDEVQIFQQGPDASQIEQLFLSGPAGACVPKATSFFWTSPIQAEYQQSTYRISMMLHDDEWNPVAGRTVHLESIVGAWPYSTSSADRVTDEFGLVAWDAPLKGATPGTYRDFLSATFSGDDEFVRAYAEPDVVVNRATPTITWSTPVPITYGTSLGPAQLNATASVAGTFSYSPPAGSVVPAGTHEITLVFDPSNTTYYSSTTASTSLTVNKATPTVVVTGQSVGYDGEPHAATGSVTGAGGISLEPLTFTYNGSPDPPVVAGTYEVVGSFAGDANHHPASGTATLTITRAAPSLSWNAPAAIVYGTALGAAQLTATASVPGAFVYTPAAGTQLPAGSGQVLSAAFTPADAANYTGGTVSTAIDVAKAAATVSVTGGTFTYDGQPHAAAGTVTGAGGAVLGPLTVTYNGAAEPPVTAGSYEVVVTFDGDANHEAASGSATVVVGQATPSLSWTAPAAIVYGTALGAAQLNATASVPGAFVYTPAAGTQLAAGNGQVLSAAFTPSDAVNYAGGTIATAIDVAKAAATVSVTSGTFTYDGQPHSVEGTVTGAGGVALGPLTLTYNGAAEPPVTAGSYEVVGTFAGDANHEAASGSGTLVIGQATTALSWSAPAAIVYGTPLGAAQLNATADVPGAFVYTPVAGTQLPAGSGQVLSATFTPADAANYASGSIATTIDVAKAAATVSVTGGTFTYDGQPHAASGSVTGAVGAVLGPLTVTYNGAAEPPVNAGSYEVVATFAGDANHEAASGSATLVIGQATASLSWTAPAAIVYGTALGAAQLTATASVPGAFVYTPAAGTQLPAGSSHALSATFTPSDAGNYVGGDVGTTIDVVKAPLTVRANDASKPYGAPLPAFSASFAGLVNGDTVASLGGALLFDTTATQQSAVGDYPIVPGGLTSSNYAIAFATGLLSIVKGSVAVSVSASPEPSGLNQPMTFTATVAAAAPASGSPSGAVRFFDGSTLLGTATLTNGTASLTTAGLPAGSHAIEARYDGDASFAAGSGQSTHWINDSSSTPALTVTSSRNPSSVGQSVTFTANVSMPAGAVAGQIQFWDGGTLLGTSAISAGRATLVTTALPAGSHAITARYTGSPSAPPAFSGVLVQAVGSQGWKNRATTASAASSSNPVALGGAVVLTATITGSTSTVPSGRVLFMVNGSVVGDPAGVPVAPVSGSTVRAALSVPDLAHGTHTVTVTYLGNATYKGSTAALSQTVN